MVSAAAALLCGFAAVVLLYVIRNARALFLPRYGRSHRLCGGAYFAWLLLGIAECAVGARRSAATTLFFDAVLGLLGVAATLTAARDFGHVRRSAASGTLDEDATVTRSEMVEHAFYQALNLAQILGLHAIAAGAAPPRVVLVLQTAPWILRGRFPVNSFSANYDRGGGATLTGVLYRAKKYQYVLYKHALLHGLNASSALFPACRVAPGSGRFRAYWLSLNAAYTHEFFLQTLVKKKIMAQGPMLALNGLLMAGSSAAAARILLAHVRWPVAAASFFLNVVHRHHDFANTLLVAAAAALVS